MELRMVPEPVARLQILSRPNLSSFLLDDLLFLAVACAHHGNILRYHFLIVGILVTVGKTRFFVDHGRLISVFRTLLDKTEQREGKEYCRYYPSHHRRPTDIRFFADQSVNYGSNHQKWNEKESENARRPAVFLHGGEDLWVIYPVGEA